VKPGDVVRARLHSAPGHTRLPLYVRGRVGTVHALRGRRAEPAERSSNTALSPRDEATGFPFADEIARTGSAPRQALYSVRFLATDLWGADAGSHQVYLDLFESYLEEGPDGA
jgi:nitrile hydratase